MRLRLVKLWSNIRCRHTLVVGRGNVWERSRLFLWIQRIACYSIIWIRLHKTVQEEHWLKSWFDTPRLLTQVMPTVRTRSWSCRVGVCIVSCWTLTWWVLLIVCNVSCCIAAWRIMMLGLARAASKCGLPISWSREAIRPSCSYWSWSRWRSTAANRQRRCRYRHNSTSRVIQHS